MGVKIEGDYCDEGLFENGIYIENKEEIKMYDPLTYPQA